MQKLASGIKDRGDARDPVLDSSRQICPPSLRYDLDMIQAKHVLL